MMASNKREAFLDTSALIDWVLDPRSKQAIHQLVQSYSQASSADYVRMEVKRGFTAYLVYLHNKAVSCSTFSEVQEQISRLSATPQRHRLGTILSTLHRFFADIGRESSDNEDLDPFLRRQLINFVALSIRRLWLRLEQLHMHDQLNCFPDIQPPVKVDGYLDNKPYRCQESQSECRLTEFLAANWPSLEAILSRLESDPSNVDEETRKRISAGRQLIRRVQLNRKCSNREPVTKQCWQCGDALIALIAPNSADILTKNARHFGPICHALGKDMIDTTQKT